ncbi:hypothetical protein BsWGS_10033 [Bradybaena similaris]
MIPSCQETLQALDPGVRPYVKYLLTQDISRLSITNDPVLVTDPCSGCLTRTAVVSNRCDRFKLKIPYAQQLLTWEVIFDSGNLKEPPDFIFDQEDDDFCPPLEQINSLVCWDWQNTESLAAVLVELLEFYKEYQLKRAGTNMVLQRHMGSLLEVSPDSLQVVINKKEKGLGTVNVLVRLDEHFSDLPAYLAEGNPGTDAAVLHVCFPYPESAAVQTQLFLSPRLDTAFGGAGSLHIPTFHHGILLGEYVENVRQLLKQQVKLVCEGYEKKKDYIAAFLSHFGTAILEYDAQSFSKIAFLFEWNDFFFIFAVELPLYFPADHPTFIFKSVYHSQNKKPYTERYINFPYSPRWTGNEMAKRAGTFILSTIKGFQKASVNNSDK